MIAKGNTHAHGAKLADYMVTGKAGEKAELYQVRGFASNDIREAFQSIAVLAAGTKCDNPMFHTQVRNPEGETLTPEQWEQTADRIERINGLTGQPRAIAFHIDQKTGHEHMHVAWSRIDAETMTAKPLPFFKLRLKEVCRELEDEFDITRVSSERPRADILSSSRAEQEQSRRLDTDEHGVRGNIRDAYEQADSGKAFAAALADKGMTLCRGERRDFIVLDEDGGIHALGKRLLGTTAAETRHRLADIDRDSLPTVAEARAQQSERPMQQMPDVAASVERAAGKAETVISTGLGAVTGAIEGLAAGLENFLFGSTKGEGQPATPAATTTAPHAEAKKAVQQMRMTTAEEAVQSADFKAKATTYTLGVRPEIVEAMRRKVEQERQREDDERDRDR